MRGITGFCGLIAATALSAGITGAQTCMGRPYFSTGPVQLGLAADFGGGISSVGAEASTGANRSFYVQGTVAHTKMDDNSAAASANEPSGTKLGVMGGYQLNFGKTSHAQFCPTLSGSWSNFDMVSGASTQRSEIAAGGTVGFVHAANSGIHYVPFAGIAAAHLNRSVETTNGAEANLGRDTYFPVTAGLGVHFENSFMLIGQVMLPVELSRADPVFGVRMVLPVGGHHR